MLKQVFNFVLHLLTWLLKNTVESITVGIRERKKSA